MELKKKLLNERSIEKTYLVAFFGHTDATGTTWNVFKVTVVFYSACFSLNCMYLQQWSNAHIFFIVSNSDYMAVSMTLDTFTNQRPRQCFNVSITNDATSEETENFTARLMLVPGSVATISADRIVVDPPEARVQITDNDHGK